jgi:RNA polymerase sigma-70 factor (ECF subfamily)
MSAAAGDIKQITDHLFRHEAGKMVAYLVKIFGAGNLESAEDIVQDTLIAALENWTFNGIPDNPPAWLFRVARNKAIDAIRSKKVKIWVDTSGFPLSAVPAEMMEENLRDEQLINDELLRMMFACCHPGISAENQITLILKTLCGFSTAEIAKAFLIQEDTVSKRLYRTKEFFRQHKVKLVIPSENELKRRTDAVLNAVYLLFNEGYYAADADCLIRENLLMEAIRLVSILANHPSTTRPDAFALLALMYFHTARSDSRMDNAGRIILLPQQDRSKWDRQMIGMGTHQMNLSAFGDVVSSYHLEAAIAFEHCIASDYASTNWSRIVACYDCLLKISPNPVTQLHRAVALMEADGPQEALIALNSRFCEMDLKKMDRYYLYHAVLGEIYARIGDRELAQNSLELAIALTSSAAEKRFLSEKAALLDKKS